MKIKRIQVKNIGPYVNENAFDFDVSDITKRMVLIGGKNGAGKTTLFNAIKICLYGCVAYGFESNNAKYFAEIEKIINANENEIGFLSDKDTLAEKAQDIFCKTNEPVLITLGARGTYLYDKHGGKIIGTDKVKNIVNTIGAGDTHCGGVIAGLF